MQMRTFPPAELTAFTESSGNVCLSGKQASLESNAALYKLEHTMNKLFARFAKNESGATAIEYGLIASLISVAIIGALTTIGSKLTTTFTNVSGNLK